MTREEYLKKSRQKRQKDREKWNASNKGKSYIDKNNNIIKINKSPSGKRTDRNRGHISKYRGNPHKMNDKTRKIFNEAKDSYTIPLAMQGFYSGVTSAFTGADLPVSKKAKNSTAYKIANIGGQMYGYGVGYGGVGKLAGKGAAKIIGTKAGQKAVTRAAGKKVFQSAARKSLVKAGQNATKKAVEHASRKTAKKVGQGLVKSAIADATVGTAMDSNIARSQGYKVGSKEWNEFMAKSAALNLAVGGAVEAAPTVVKGLSKGSSKKSVEKIVNGKAKKVKVEKTYKDFSVENAARKKAEQIKESKKVLDDAKRQYDSAKKNNVKVEETRKAYRKAQSDYVKVIKDSSAKTDAYKVNHKAPASQYRKPANEPVSAGKVTKIEHPYKGETPKVVETQEYSVPELPRKTLDNVEYLKNNVEKSELKKQLKEEFGQPRVVSVKNVQFGNNPYKVRLNKKIVGKIVSTRYETENLAILGNLDDIVANGKYVGSSEYIPHGAKQKETVRFDYFETPIRIDGEDYIAKFDVEVFPDVNNYKTHNVVHNIKEIDLVPKSATDVNPNFTATDRGKGLSYNVSENVQNVNGHKEFDHQEAFKDPDFVRFIGEKSGGSVPNLAKENGISVNEQTRRLYDEYMGGKSYTHPNSHKDLGADTYKRSTQTVNAEKYGTDRGVVNATPYGETSQTAKTIYNSDMVDATTKKKLAQEINDGLYAKYTKTNKTSIDNATRRIEKDGIKTARDEFNGVAIAGNARSEDIALGYKLAETYQKNGDYDNVMKVLNDVANMESEAGRTLQAMTLFNSFSPEGRKMAVRKNISKMTKEMDIDIKVPNGLIELLGKATDERTINRLKKQIFKEVWDQIPASWTQKANAWRYMCMLANPKTHVRNILGNAIFVPVKGMRNIVASGLEKMLIREGERSKAILTPKDKDLIKMGKEDFENIKDAIMGNSRYIEGQRDLDAKIFKSRLLEWLRKKSGGLLEKEDEVFMGIAYKRSYAQYLKANGARAGEKIPEELLHNARSYATKEALNSTYRDASALADFFASGKKYANMPLKQVPGDTVGSKMIKKAGSMALDATVPFTKTLINIMRRGWDYSPGGLIQGMGKILRSGGDNVKLIEGIAKVASGLTGTGVMTLGAYMSMHGLAQGSLDTSTVEGKYKQMMGEQEYSIRIGDYTYTFDWAAPMSMPFFVGVELGNEFEKNGISFDAVLGAMKGITDPVFNLSMLSGLNTALDTAFDDNPTLGVAGNIMESYAGQYIPTVFGQIARTLTSEKRTSTSTAENPDARSRERFLNQLKNKIPGLTDSNEPYVDLWGRTEKKRSLEDYALAAFQNFISPGTLKSTKRSFVDEELFDLGDELGDMSEIVPRTAGPSEYDKKFKDINHHMSEKDLATYKKAKGEYAKEGLYDLFDTKKYRDMSADEKRKAIKDVYDEAKDRATQEFLASHNISREEYMVEQMGKNQRKAYKKSGMDIDEFDQLYKITKNVNKNDGSVTKAMKLIGGGAENYHQAASIYDVSEHAYRNAKNLYNLGLKPNQITKIAKNADANGNKRFTTTELVNYLEGTNYTQYEKRYIFAALANWNAHNPY